MHIFLKKNIKIYIKTAPTYFDVITFVKTTATLASSNSALPDDGHYTKHVEAVLM
jgi:hypothetical protein